MRCQRAETFTFHYNFLFSSYNRHLLSLFMKIANLQMLLRYFQQAPDNAMARISNLLYERYFPCQKIFILYFFLHSSGHFMCMYQDFSWLSRCPRPTFKGLDNSDFNDEGDFNAGGAYWAALLQSCQWFCSNLSSLSLIIASLIL